MNRRQLSMIALAVLASSVAGRTWAAPELPLPLPPLVLPGLPDLRQLVRVPKTDLYFVPDVDADVVLFDGYWWTPRDGGWYRARDYRREFTPVPPAYVPAPLLKLRPDFRRHYRHEKRVPYGEWRKKNWRPEWDGDRRDEWEEHRPGADRQDANRPEGRDKDRGENRDRGEREKRRD